MLIAKGNRSNKRNKQIVPFLVNYSLFFDPKLSTELQKSADEKFNSMSYMISLRLKMNTEVRSLNDCTCSCFYVKREENQQ